MPSFLANRTAQQLCLPSSLFMYAAEFIDFRKYRHSRPRARHPARFRRSWRTSEAGLRLFIGHAAASDETVLGPGWAG